jgi:tetratricopeptide (TPR) repeat protein
MARKKRRIEPVAVTPAPADKKDKRQYQDQFQQTVGKRVEEAGKVLEGQGRNILYGLAALAVLGIIIWIIYAWSGRSNAAAQAALGKAIETSQAPVTDQPVPAGTTIKVFKTEAERANAAIAEFNAVAEKFGGDVGEKAKYFAAVNKLTVDRAAGIQELEALSKSNDEAGKMAKFALAQAKASEGKADEAVALYQELAATEDPIVAKETINFELAKLYEKQGKTADAVNLLFNIVKEANEARDPEGKPVPLTSTAMAAKEKLEQLDPAKAKELPEQPVEESPFGN